MQSGELPAHRRTASMPMLKRPRVEDPKYLKWIRTLPCVVSGNNVTVQAAHVRFSDARFFKQNPGVGQKPLDMWCLPLSSELHLTGPHAQHDANERKWWVSHGIDAPVLCMALWLHRYDIEACASVIENARRTY